MVSKLGDMNRIPGNFINETMLVVDAAGPVTRKRMFKRLWFSEPLKRVALRFLDECVYPTENFLVGFLPIKIVLPRVIRENELQSISALSVPSSFSSWDMDSIRRLMFFGERRRYAVSSRAL